MWIGRSVRVVRRPPLREQMESMPELRSAAKKALVFRTVAAILLAVAVLCSLPMVVATQNDGVAKASAARNGTPDEASEGLSTNSLKIFNNRGDIVSSTWANAENVSDEGLNAGRMESKRLFVGPALARADAMTYSSANISPARAEIVAIERTWEADVLAAAAIACALVSVFCCALAFAAFAALRAENRKEERALRNALRRRATVRPAYLEQTMTREKSHHVRP